MHHPGVIFGISVTLAVASSLIALDKAKRGDKIDAPVAAIYAVFFTLIALALFPDVFQ